MPRNLMKDLQLREERIRQILETASRIFAKNGINAKMSDIAKEAGLSHGHIYNYFSSKVEILLKIIENNQNRHRELLLKAKKIQGNALDKLRFIAASSLKRNAEGYIIMLQALSSDLISESDKAQIRQRLRRNMELLVPIIDEGQKEGLIKRSDPVILSTFFTVLHQNLLHNEMRGFDKVDEKALDLLIELFTSKEFQKEN